MAFVAAPCLGPRPAPGSAVKHLVTLDKLLNVPDFHRKAVDQVISRAPSRIQEFYTESPKCRMNFTF